MYLETPLRPLLFQSQTRRRHKPAGVVKEIKSCLFINERIEFSHESDELFDLFILCYQEAHCQINVDRKMRAGKIVLLLMFHELFSSLILSDGKPLMLCFIIQTSRFKGCDRTEIIKIMNSDADSVLGGNSISCRKEEICKYRHSNEKHIKNIFCGRRSSRK